ncbi:hypothetical protein [Acetobacter malorum]|nr:hypothetical protein [Acetobacter malorum]KXV06728.1 hypothetical protein AD930_06390 [Acetobacter malorum]
MLSVYIRAQNAKIQGEQMQVKVKIENIQWDTDGVSPEEIGLPAHTEVTVDVTGRLRADEIKPSFSEMSEDAARVLDELVADEISDEFGYCVVGGSRYPKGAISLVSDPAITLSKELTTLPEGLRINDDNLDLSAKPEPDEDSSPAP